MLALVQTSQFRRDLKKAIKRGRDLVLLTAIIDTLQREKPLPPANRDHALVGDYIGHRECHVQPDWLLVYRVDHAELILVLQRTGTHADLM
ncbi:MAG: type II toxin-antitoxin system YafQ family toxin [Propionibacteriaceae bacterium]|nr:type II toxin-antitoxin system YafQ family toxin [Propionibacteriaceae bacterium]